MTPERPYVVPLKFSASWPRFYIYERGQWHSLTKSQYRKILMNALRRMILTSFPKGVIDWQIKGNCNVHPDERCKVAKIFRFFYIGSCTFLFVRTDASNIARVGRKVHLFINDQRRLIPGYFAWRKTFVSIQTTAMKQNLVKVLIRLDDCDLSRYPFWLVDQTCYRGTKI